jgi:hypothetical protein
MNGANTFHFDGSIHRGRANQQVGVHPAVAIAIVLDPHFKLLNGFDNNEDKVRIWDALLVEMILRGDTVTTEEEETYDNPGRNEGNKDPFLASNAEDDDLAFFIDQITEANANDNTAQQEHTPAGGLGEQCEMELAAYRRLPSLPILNEKKEYNNPLKWWRDRQMKLPILTKLARIYLCIPATSAPSEHIFSMATSRLINKLRARLTPENAGRILFVNINIGWYEAEHGLIV